MRTAAIICALPPEPAVGCDPRRSDASSGLAFSQNFTGPARERRPGAGDLAANRGKALLRGPRPGDHDEVDARRKEPGLRAKYLAHKAFCPIAGDRPADLPGGHDAQAAGRQRGVAGRLPDRQLRWLSSLGFGAARGPIANDGLRHEEDEMIRGDAGASVLNADKIAALAQPAAPRVSKATRGPRGLDHRYLA